jgi:predicted RNase H-like HicB family nuclease
MDPEIKELWREIKEVVKRQERLEEMILELIQALKEQNRKTPKPPKKITGEGRFLEEWRSE